MKEAQENPFLEFCEKYYDKPVLFVQEVLKKQPDPWQCGVLEDIAAGERLISIRSGHGTGKSTVLAFACTWYACTRYPFKIVMTAPTAPQLFDALWAETKTQFRELPAAVRDLFNLKSERIELVASPEAGFISARTSTKERPEALAGVHSDNVLLLPDEASAIPEEVFESAAGSMSGYNATTILTGNPTRLTGLFYKTHHELSDDWKTYHVNSEDSSRVSQEFVDQIRKTYGRESNQYRVRVLGEFPLTEDDCLIGRKIVKEAMERDIAAPEIGSVKKIWAVDPARYGSDKSGFAERMGSVVTELVTKSNLNTMQLSGWVKKRWDEAVEAKTPPDIILIDVIGIGAGVFDRLKELGLPVRPINVSESALVTSDGYKLRDHLWLEYRGWLQAGIGKLPYSKELLEESVSVTYNFTSNGKTKVESKELLRRRGIKSPNLADAVCMTFAVEPATLVGGRHRDWQKPIKRGLVGYG
jgi:hypothetical protein